MLEGRTQLVLVEGIGAGLAFALARFVRVMPVMSVTF